MAELHRRQIRPRVIRTGVGLFVFGGLVVLLVRHPDHLVVLVFAHAFTFPLIAGIVGIALHAEAMSQFSAQQRARRERLTERLRFVPGDQVAAALLTLRTDRTREVRSLAKRLLREMDLPTEVAPVAVPGPAGNEVSTSS
jgi:hypothetical protein